MPKKILDVFFSNLWGGWHWFKQFQIKHLQTNKNICTIRLWVLKIFFSIMLAETTVSLWIIMIASKNSGFFLIYRNKGTQKSMWQVLVGGGVFVVVLEHEEILLTLFFLTELCEIIFFYLHMQSSWWNLQEFKSSTSIRTLFNQLSYW